MKIAIVSSILNFAWGGADKPWTHMAETAKKEGHQLLLAVSPTVMRHPRIVALARSGACIFERRQFSGTNSRHQRLRRLLGRDEWYSLRSTLVAFAPDALLLNQGGVFDFTLERRLVSWCHDHQVPLILYCNCNSDSWSLNADDRRFAREVFAIAARVFFVSTHNWRLAERQIGARISNAQVIQNPIDPSLLAAPHAWPSIALTCAVVSRIDAHHKGLDLLIPALADAWPKPWPWELNIFGTGPDAPYIKELARLHGLADRIHFRGFANDIRKLWASHHLMLMPSRHEGCSISMLEALACGRPVLATDVGGVSDWIQNNVNGFVCPAPTVNLLAITLRHAWATRESWANLGERAAQGFRTHYDCNPERALLASMMPTTNSST